MQLFGTSGIRRLADEELIQLALKVGLVVGGVYPSVAVGCDTRTSSQAMKHALISGLLSAGSRCCDAGVVPLPTLAYYTARHRGCSIDTPRNLAKSVTVE
jgi:phosphoglucosamine mutase